MNQDASGRALTIESAKLAGIGPHTYLKTAITAALRGQQIPLPHEVV